MDPFTYEEIDPSNQIRLLKLTISNDIPQWSLLPSPVDSGDEEMMRGAPYFEDCFAAVSYEWDDPDDPNQTMDFNIGGRTLQIGKNLWQFLQLISDRAKESSSSSAEKTFCFWIDSICINQNDSLEKSAQIGLLTHIYESANYVISWLRDTRHYKAMDALSKNTRRPNDENLKNLKEDLDKLLNARDDNTHEGSIATYDKDTRDDLHELLNERYWTRIWMVQEVVLPRRWRIMCSNRIIDGENLTKLIQQSKGKEFRFSKGHNYVMERIRHQADGPTSLLRLICRFMYLDSTFQEDKIRALLALSSEDTKALETLLQEFGNSEIDSRKRSECKDKICNELVQLAEENNELIPRSKEVYQNLVAGVLGVNLNYLAAKVEASIPIDTRDFSSDFKEGREAESAPFQYRLPNKRSEGRPTGTSVPSSLRLTAHASKLLDSD